jgi:hypothetical protein
MKESDYFCLSLRLFFICWLLGLLAGCSAGSYNSLSDHTAEAKKTAMVKDRRPVWVFKLIPAWASLVPVQVNQEGTVISYPAPSDLAKLPGHGAPHPLEASFYLDRGSISCGAAFLNYTREAWSKLTEAPSLARQRALVLPGAQASECYDCTEAFLHQAVNEDSLRWWIRSGTLLKHCKKQ